jgi:hypothetical protein
VNHQNPLWHLNQTGPAGGWKIRKACSQTILADKFHFRQPLGRLSDIDTRKIGCEDVDWIKSAWSDHMMRFGVDGVEPFRFIIPEFSQ